MIETLLSSVLGTYTNFPSGVAAECSGALPTLTVAATELLLRLRTATLLLAVETYANPPVALALQAGVVGSGRMPAGPPSEHAVSINAAPARYAASGRAYRPMVKRRAVPASSGVRIHASGQGESRRALEWCVCHYPCI